MSDQGSGVPPQNGSGWQDVHQGAPPPNQQPPQPPYGQAPPQYPPPGYQQQPPPGYQQQPGYPPYAAPQSGMTSTTAAAVAYLTFIPAVIFLLSEPYKRDPFVRFHAWQSIALNVLGFAGSILFSFLFISGMWGLIFTLHRIWDLILFVAWLVGIINAGRGQWFKLPVIGDIAASMSK